VCFLLPAATSKIRAALEVSFSTSFFNPFPHNSLLLPTTSSLHQKHSSYTIQSPPSRVFPSASRSFKTKEPLFKLAPFTSYFYPFSYNLLLLPPSSLHHPAAHHPSNNNLPHQSIATALPCLLSSGKSTASSPHRCHDINFLQTISLDRTRTSLLTDNFAYKLTSRSDIADLHLMFPRIVASILCFPHLPTYNLHSNVMLRCLPFCLSSN
jgi:hypothetical protein